MVVLSMMVRLMTGLAFAAVTLALLTTPAAHAVRARRPTASVVVRSPEGLVFSRPNKSDPLLPRLYYGCLFRVRENLPAEPERLRRQPNRVDSVRLAGPFASYQQDWGSPAGDATNSVTVRDLRTGVVIHDAPVSRLGGDSGDFATDSVLKRSGSVAWIAQTTDENDDVVFEVGAMTAATRRRTKPRVEDKPLLLDSGPRIVPRSLELSRDHRRVSWSSGGTRKSYQLR
ncbi:MAG TPA: hypothetical protein VE570_11240 [Thermoleophilaceae bacterium]|jgi:hypothetical protein|nr:hypothetical protein [Thermoleophilaceae bacterium]